MSDLVSVIIPIYNVEKYIKTTIESVINQDYGDIEIILVNDGSTDKSAQIMSDFARSDSRIICINKENGGVSTARNAGLRRATGDYVTFIDGDDWVDNNYVSYMLNLVKSQNCEIAMNKRNYSEFNAKSSDKTYTVSSEKAIEWIYTGELFVAVWNKIYKTSFLRDHDILFDESIWYGEGMLFNIDCLQFTNVVAIGEKNVYHQVSNPESAMRKFSVESNLCGIRSLDVQREHWKKINKRIINAWNFHRWAFNIVIIRGLANYKMEEEYSALYESCIQDLKRNAFKSLKVDIPLKHKLGYIEWVLFTRYLLNKCKSQ